MKFTRREENQMREFFSKMDRSGCVPVTEWVSGKGRYTRAKAFPPFVERFERKEYPQTARPHNGTLERTAFEFFCANPRRRAVLVMDKDAAFRFLFDSAHGREF